MRKDTYIVEAAVEETHWWFVGRRRLFGREIAAAGLARDCRVLDIGSGTGANLRLLRHLGFTAVTGLDSSPESIRACAEKGLGEVRPGDIRALPFPDDSLDLVLATDVVEHVDDDLAAIREITRVLVPGGLALLTVPAFQSLWGLQDIVSHHKRRYRMALFLDTVRHGGLVPTHWYYFNFLLFLPIWLARQLIRVLGIEMKSENELNSGAINRVLTWVFHLDVALAPLLRPPFGVSILVLARKGRK